MYSIKIIKLVFTIANTGNSIAFHGDCLLVTLSIIISMYIYYYQNYMLLALSSCLVIELIVLHTLRIN